MNKKAFSLVEISFVLSISLILALTYGLKKKKHADSIPGVTVNLTPGVKNDAYDTYIAAFNEIAKQFELNHEQELILNFTGGGSRNVHLLDIDYKNRSLVVASSGAAARTISKIYFNGTHAIYPPMATVPGWDEGHILNAQLYLPPTYKPTLIYTAKN